MFKFETLALAAPVWMMATVALTAQATAGDSSGNFMVMAGVSGVLPNSKF